MLIRCENEDVNTEWNALIFIRMDLEMLVGANMILKIGVDSLFKNSLSEEQSHTKLCQR